MRQSHGISAEGMNDEVKWLKGLQGLPLHCSLPSLFTKIEKLEKNMTKLVLSLAGSYLSGLLHFLALFPDNSVLGITETIGLDDATAGLLQVVLEATHTR